MTEVLTTIESLVASVWQSFVAANELILQSSRSAPEPDKDNGLEQHARFMINNALGKVPGAIPLALFYSNTTYHLSDLRLDIPCYTIQGIRLGWKRSTRELYSFAPTLWQRLFCICHLYRLVIKIDFNKVEVIFLAASEEDAIRRTAGKVKRHSHGIAWKFKLTPEQERHLLALPGIVARPIYWRSAFRRVWRRLTGK